MFPPAETRTTRYRTYAAELRRLVDRTPGDVERRQMLALAKKFEGLAATVERSKLAQAIEVLNRPIRWP